MNKRNEIQVGTRVAISSQGKTTFGTLIKWGESLCCIRIELGRFSPKVYAQTGFVTVAD